MSRRLSILFFVGLWALGLTPSLGQRIAERWTLTPERPATELRFGRSVAVSGDLVVVGESKVAIYDHRRWARTDGELSLDEKFFFLKAGDRFDLRRRRELAPAFP